MITRNIEDVKDIKVDATRYEVNIEIEDIRGSTNRDTYTRADAELLLERLQGALNKV
jgi:hypothetical protein